MIMVLRKISGLSGMVLATSLLIGGVAMAAGTAKMQNGGQEPIPPRQSWSFAGPFGGFDPAQLQRGFEVYQKVCSACHSLNLVAFRDLASPDGPDFSESQVKALAASYKIKDGPNDSGDMFERPGRPADHFPSPFPNEQAAAAAFGTAPPDMSDLAKARTYPRPFPLFIFDAFTQYQEQGPDYIVGIMNGYTHP